MNHSPYLDRIPRTHGQAAAKVPPSFKGDGMDYLRRGDVYTPAGDAPELASVESRGNDDLGIGVFVWTAVMMLVFAGLAAGYSVWSGH